MSATRRRETLDLAVRLARRKGFDPAWITYPAWAGDPAGSQKVLETAEKYRKWAAAILAGDLPPPAWLVREDALRQPRTEEKSKEKSEKEDRRFIFGHYIEAPAPAFAPKLKLPASAPKPTREEILDLAIRLDPCGKDIAGFINYPPWASYPPEYEPMLRVAAKLRGWATAILAGEAPVPAWLVRDEPARWTAPPPLPKPPPAPARLSQAERYFRLRSLPLAASWLLYMLSRPSPTLARPPPGRRRAPPLPAGAGPAWPAAPPREWRCPTRDLLFDNRIAVILHIPGSCCRMDGVILHCE